MNSAEIISLNQPFERQACMPVEEKLSKWMDMRTVRQLSSKSPSLLNSNAKLALIFFFNFF